MSTTRKLKDALSKAAGVQIVQEPVVVKVATVDKTAALAEVAKQGIAAIEALTVERNDSVGLAANLNLKLNVVQANNVDLRERESYWKEQCFAMMDTNSRLQAYLNQARGLLQLIAQEVHRGNEAKAMMQPLMAASNNPELPPVDVMGLPVELTEDDEVEPANNGVTKAVSVGNEHIKEMIARLDAIQ